MTDVDPFLKIIMSKIFGERASTLRDAVCYSLFSGGKKVRSQLCFLVCKNENGVIDHAVIPACALEMVHTYSLIHDDLPSMDNDDLRRGKPTCHKVFGDAQAILAGDALLTDAFLVLSDTTFLPSKLNMEQRLLMVKILAEAAGAKGMILGQNFELHYSNKKNIGWDDLKVMHSHKTGKLFGAALAFGGIAAGVAKARVDELFEAGELLGLAFQIKDDLIDSSLNTGKTPGKDHIQGKLTVLKILSEAQAKEKLYSITEESLNLIKSANSDLEKYIYSLLGRTH